MGVCWAALVLGGCGEEADREVEPESASEEIKAAWDRVKAPAWGALEALPGGLDEAPLFVSNNPEIFHGDGLLAGTYGAPGRNFPATKFEAGCPAGTARSMDVYTFHINKTGSQKKVALLVSAVGGDAKVVVEGAINANQWAMGKSSSWATSRDMLGAWPHKKTIQLKAQKVAEAGSIVVGQGNPVDTRYRIRVTEGSGCLVVREVAGPAGAGVDALLGLGQKTNAPGEIKSPSKSTGAFGRTAGVYRGTTWAGAASLDITEPTTLRGYRFDSQEQAAESYAVYADSNPRGVGNYGVLYDLDFSVQNRTAGCINVTAALDAYPKQLHPNQMGKFLAENKDPDPTRFWDGVARINNSTLSVLTTPKNPEQPLASGKLAPGKGLVWTFAIPVPGLISIPGAIVFKTDPC